MASISNDNGNRTIQFRGSDDKRHSIRLGKVPKKIAEAIKVKVEHLNSMKINRLPLDADTAAWLETLGDELAGKLAAVGLTSRRESLAMGAFLDKFLERRRADDSKPATVVNLNIVANDLRGYFKDDVDLRSVTVDRAEDFKHHYQTRMPKLAVATVSRRLTSVRMIFEYAKEMKLIPTNPFENVASRNSSGSERKHYIPLEDFRKLLAACKSPHWRTIIALSRLGGLRCPSEVLSLRVADLNFANGRMVVRSPKTERFEGKESRLTPIFVELRPFLEDAEGEYVIGGEFGERNRAKADTPRGWMNANLRTNFEKIIKRAGLAPWPRLFHNLRASCETDLMQKFPIHVVTTWLGNTPGVAIRHYLQVLDRDFDAASGVVQKAGELKSGPNTLEAAGAAKDLAKPAIIEVNMEKDLNMGTVQMGDTGFEPVAVSSTSGCILQFPSRDHGANTGGANSASDPLRAAILRIVAGADGDALAVIHAAAVGTLAQSQLRKAA